MRCSMLLLTAGLVTGTLAAAAPGYADTPPPADRPEWSIDLYGGTTWTRDTDLDTFDFTVPAGVSLRAHFDQDPTFGARLLVFAPGLRWLGGAVDVSWFEADGDRAEATVVPLSILAVVRAPLLATPEEPGGRLQPYLAAGPTYAFVDFRADLRPEVAGRVSETTAGAGFDLRAGLRVPVHRRLGLFAEYRFTSIRVEAEETFGSTSAVTRTTEGRLLTHHVVGGISFRF